MSKEVTGEGFKGGGIKYPKGGDFIPAKTPTPTSGKFLTKNVRFENKNGHKKSGSR